MAIMAYTGVMGSGKTYEGVSTAALNALKQGRRVVTNISGFNYDAIRDYLGNLSDGSMLEPEKIVVIHSKRVTEPHFFFDPDVQSDSVVKPGDLVLIDEVWAFWGTDAKLPAEHMKFFRMHRHYTELGTGTSCDLVIMIQDLTSLHRSIKGVLESTFKFTKMKTLGLSSAYRVEVYEGRIQRKSTLVSASVKKYDKRIFPLYKSYDGGQGNEKVVDDRQNLLRNKSFLFVIFLAVAGLLFAGFWFVRYVGRLQNGGDTKPVVSSTQQNQIPSQSVSELPPPVLSPTPASDVRLVGFIEHSNGETTVIFQLADGRTVRQRMNSGEINGWETTAGYNGRMTAFSIGAKGK
jgi:zona occludens toxin